jgi:glycosyltransferase involved in cell wall biosynthesis
MRIWIINHYALAPADVGGTRHYNFARQLIKRGHEVIIIASNYNHFSQSYIKTNTKIGEIDYTYEVPFLWIPSPAYTGNTLARFWNMLIFSLRLHKKKFLSTLFHPDVIIGSSPHLFSALSAQLLSRRYKVRFLLEIRDIWPDTLVDLGKFTQRHPLIKLMKYIEKYLYKHSDKIICLLPMAASYFAKLGVDIRRIITIPNAIDTDHIPQKILFPEVTSHFQPQDNIKFTVMYAGSHGLANDLETILLAGKILQKNGFENRIQICLIGNGPDKDRLKLMASKEQITIVKFMDAVPKHEIYDILNQADAYIMLLKNSPVFRWGISPNKLFDYLIMGKPVIFGVESPFNPIQEFNAGISIKPSHPESLAAAIYDLSIIAKEKLHEMGLRGREFVLKNHNTSYLTDILENCITKTSKDY